MDDMLNDITTVIMRAAEESRRETGSEPEPELRQPVQWPVQCTVGPGLEGAIASETKIGYVNGAKGQLIYRGYDIFDLCAYSSFEDVSYLLLHGKLPNESELRSFKQKLVEFRMPHKTLRLLMGFPVEEMNPMGALRLGTNMMRQEFTNRDREAGKPALQTAIGSDEDSIAMETVPKGARQATYEFKTRELNKKTQHERQMEEACGIDACYCLISAVATITAAVARVRQGSVPIEPDPELGHAANFLYMLTGRRPSPLQERIMDIALILHADHGMNASTFAAMVVASTLSDIFFSVGAGIAALNGPLHGGANEQVVRTLELIGGPENVTDWLKKTLEHKRKIAGFGHRVYKAYDPRARILSPLAEFLVQDRPDLKTLHATARILEQQIVKTLERQKMIFPNVDFFSGLVYCCLGINPEVFTPIFAISRVAGWTARVYEYLQKNRIFRPRAIYIGEFNKTFVPVEKRP